jgi:hypothetical protein
MPPRARKRAGESYFDVILSVTEGEEIGVPGFLALTGVH